METVKLVTGVGEVLNGKILLFNGLNQSYQTITFTLKPENLRIDRLQKSYGAELCETTPSIQMEEIEIKLNAGNPLQIIDVRTEVEFENFSLPQIKTLNIPLDELRGRMDELNFNRPIYLLCQSGKRSAMAVGLLQEINNKLELYNIIGGVDWFLAHHKPN